MVDDTAIQSLPLSSLPLRTRELLSCLLDTPKIIPSDGPDKLPRDWRGLAYLVNISSEKAAYIQLSPSKTTAVLEIWQQDRTATVGQLLNYLERLDRYDVYDDLCLDLRQSIQNGDIVVNRQNQITIHTNNNNNKYEVCNVITYDDTPYYLQQYDAFVLYAKEDKPFVDELMRRMTKAGYKLCTEERLQAGHSTPYAPITQLMWERCPRIIMVCSPAFLNSPSNSFYRDYAQAVSIESRNHKILPIIYIDCQLPSHLAFYHKLYYNEEGVSAMYDFWEKLSQSLELAKFQRQHLTNSPNGITRAVQPRVELPPSSRTCTDDLDDQLFLPSVPRCSSAYNLDSLRVRSHMIDCNSLSSLSQKSGSSEKKKKKNPLTRILNIFTPKKNKKVFMVAS